jgi:hypothetical protein
VLETEFDNAPALGLYTSLGFVPEKRLHRFYLNGKDAFRLVLPLGDAADPAAMVPGNTEHKRRPFAHPPPLGISDDDDDNDAGQSTALGRGPAFAPGSPSSSADDEDYAEGTAKLVRLRRRYTALRACRMVTVWPADEDDRVSGR